ncbi:hypothetical protein BO71DRAFT_397986 [Aspergillus ellipticus CBS 707.79]|uniref:Calcineurin-like phosphoesterase domain-containing protein n=1 Tax=Aspergillus ellipticus CBS 707.79 TaxID=1448320 RepID=A0A319DE10_9EURO|nr:hypothetical protein BO71DRAFT_397986 [Aspergillus ellipticus CBS 707.79]
MARFQIVSDLHLEKPMAYDLFDIPVKAPYLALLGDIGNVKDDDFLPFIEKQLYKFQIVFLVLGNHEPFHSSWPDVRAKLSQLSDDITHKRAQSGPNKLGEFVLLDQTRYQLAPDMTVLGCTFHSKVSEAQEERVSFGMNDFYYIADWSVEAHCAAHEAERAWLNDQVSEIASTDPHHKIVIFTHHSPTVAPQAVDPAHAHSPISSGFATDLVGEACWDKPQVRLWGFGHTHYNCDFTESRTGKRIVANQRGYYFAQANAFDPEKVISV